MRPMNVVSAWILIGSATLCAGTPACNRNEADSKEPTATRTSAITAAIAGRPSTRPPLGAYRASDIGPQPGMATVPPQRIPQRRAVPASQYPAHFRNKVVDKPPPNATDAPPPVPAAYIAKQNEYLRQSGELEPTISSLPPEEREARRAALKRQVLGD